jgi:broad specificity phosphatase PhoE
VTIYLVRHARAGSRQRWKQDDALRPLSKVGRAQAVGIARTLSERHVDRIVSSPFARCVQTVEPLATKLGIAIETSDALAEGAPLPQALRLVEKVLDQDVVLCTHGDVIRELLDHFAHHGVKLRDDRMEKGSIWVLDVEHGEVTRAHYLPPPKAR